MSVGILAHNLEPLHVDGRYLKNSKGDIVTLHGYMTVLDPGFQTEDYGWEGYDVATCLKNKKGAIDRLLTSSWKMDYVRFGLDAYWFSDDMQDQVGSFNFVHFKKYFEELFLPLIEYFHEKGIYTLLWPQQGTPELIEFGDMNQEQQLLMWDYVSSHPRIRNNPGVMFELANEPVGIKCHQGDSYDPYWGFVFNKTSSFREFRDYWQPVVDKIRSHCDNIVYIPGLQYESDHAGYADYPIAGENIGYAVHWYPGWWGNMRKDWEDHVFPIAYKAPIIITENAWAPYNNYLYGNSETSTSKFGKPLKDIVDELGNVSWNCYEPEEDYYYLVNSSSSSEKAVISNNPEACFKAMYQWWEDYSTTKMMLTSQLKAKAVSFDEFPTACVPGQKYLAKIKAEFTNGMTWDVSGDAEYTIADESVLRIKNGVIWALKEGTTTVTVKYTDGTGKTFSRQFEVNNSFFPLTKDGFVLDWFSLDAGGSFDEVTGTFSSEGPGSGGWDFEGGMDLSSYKYLVLQLNQEQHCWATVHIFDNENLSDENSAWNDDTKDVGFSFNDATELVIDLQSLHKQNGEPLDLSHIYRVDIWINGAEGPVSIKRVFLSNDGITPAYQEPTCVYADNKVMYDGDEVPDLTFSISGLPINGTPKLSTTANSASFIGTYPITIERGSVSNDQVTFIDGTLTIMKRPMYSTDYEPEDLDFETAAEAVKNMRIGWNLWNTLDSSPGVLYDSANYKSWETDWGNPEATAELMKMIRKAGFNAIRVPVTWYPYTDEKGNVDSRWMARVHEVVDYVIDQGMYCLLNVHHDTGGYETSWIRADEKNYQKNHERFENIWRQIAEEFKDYDEHLLFEGYNEMLDIWDSWGRAAWGHDDQMESVYTALNNYAQSFVNTVRSTGGNNKKRNLVVNTYAASMDTGDGFPLTEIKIPDDESKGHIAIQIHYYPDGITLTEKEIDETIESWNKAVQSKGTPLIVGEWGMWPSSIVKDEEYVRKFTSLSRYFIEKTKANDIATFSWEGPICWGPYRSLPAFMSSEYINALMKGYYGDWYEPTLITEDEYDFLGVKVSFDYQWAELSLYGEEINLNEYNGIRVEVENIDGLIVKFYGNPDDKWQLCGMTSTSETFTFDKSSLGNKVTGITLQNGKEGKNETKLLNACLIRNDGTEETISFSKYGAYHGCEYEFIMPRKLSVHTVEYDNLWAELNLFYDDIPLKLKNYKGIRLELAEMSKDVHVKVYGDGEQKEDYIGIADASTTILFNTDIFSNEINRVTLQRNQEGKGEAKVIGAWLIRQDGTEEYSDLSSFHGCEITKVEKYVPEQPVTITAKDLTMTYGDEVPELTYTSEGGKLNGTPKLSTTATKTSPVGTYPIKVERGTVANTQATFVDGTLTITKAPLTVGVQDVTIIEDDDIPTFTLTYDGWRNNDAEATAFTKKPTAKTSATNKSKAGTYTITVSGGEAKNYMLSYQSGTLTIKENGSTSPWTSLVLNGDIEGGDVSCFYMRENAAKNDKIVSATIVDGAGKNNSRGIVIHSTNNPPEVWNTQFFIRLTQSLPAGTKYRMSLDYKASQDADVPMECHVEPGDYIHWDFGSLTFTKSWKHYEKEGTITEEQSTAEKKMHTIAFNLANVKTATTYYFDNIVFEIENSQVEQPVIISANNLTMIYGDEVPTLTYKSSGAALNGTPKLTTTATKTSPVGTYPIKVEQGTVSNGQMTYVDGVLTITKAPLTITANSYTRKQGENNPKWEVTYEGFKNGETEEVLTQKPTIRVAATPTSPTGTYTISVSRAEADNYDIKYVSGKLTVTEAEAVTVMAKSYSRVYGDENPVFEYVSQGAELAGKPEISCEVTTTSPVGTYPIVIKKGGVTNYNDTYIDGVLTITKAPLTIMAKSYTRRQGENNPKWEVTYEGFKNGETEEVLTQKPTIRVAATPTSPAGTYTISVSRAAAENYDIKYVSGKLTVLEPDGISDAAQQTPYNVRIFSVGGKPRKELQKGVNIVVRSDRTTGKIVIK